MMERQISPNPPEAFSKRLATENKLSKIHFFGKYGKFGLYMEAKQILFKKNK